MKVKELTSLKTKELKEVNSLLQKKKLELGKVQVKILSGKEKNLKMAKNLKKEIAQILSIISEKSRMETKTEKSEKRAGVKEK